MSSEKKKRKLKNSYQCPGGLKQKLRGGIKRLSFFTASARQEIKKETQKEND